MDYPSFSDKTCYNLSKLMLIVKTCVLTKFIAYEVKQGNTKTKEENNCYNILCLIK